MNSTPVLLDCGYSSTVWYCSRQSRGLVYTANVVQLYQAVSADAKMGSVLQYYIVLVGVHLYSGFWIAHK